jgi:hypothetical protein
MDRRLATSPFVRRNVQLAIPVGARTMRTSLVSGGPEETTGTMLIDNLSMALEPTPPTVLFGNLWPNSGFEAGTDLDNPVAGTPNGWQKGGSDAGIKPGDHFQLHQFHPCSGRSG